MLEYLRTKELSTRWAVAILLGALLVLFAPFLIFGKMYLDGDTIMYTYPAAYLLKTFPDSILNIFSFGGYPVTVAFHVGFFSPIYRFFFGLFDYLFAYHLILFLDYVAAALLTYYFIRNLNKSVYASLIGAMVFTMGQWGVYWMSSINISHTMYLLPAMLLSVLKIKEGRWGYAALVSVLIGLALTYTHYQFILMALMWSGLFMLYLVIGEVRMSPKRVLLVLGVFAVACGLGFLLGAPQLLRTMEFLPLSMRSVFTAELSVWYMDLFRYLIPNFELPRFSTQEFMPYVGIIPLFLALLALWKVRKDAWRPYGKFFAWTFVLVIIFALKYSPLFYLLKSLPFIGHYFLQPSRFLYLGNFAVAVLAAVGFDYMIVHKESLTPRFVRNFKRFTYIFTGGVVLANVLYFALRNNLLAFAKNYFDVHKYSQTIGLPREYYHSLIELMSDRLFYNMSLLNIYVVLCIASLFAILLLVRYVNNRKLFSNLLVIFVLINLLAGMVNLRFGNRELLETKPRFAEVISSLEKNPEDYRVLSYLVPFAQYRELLALHPDARVEGFTYTREALLGNLHFFSGIPIVGGYEPIAPRRYQSMLYHLESVPQRVSPKDLDIDILQKANFLSMMNARYIVSPYDLSHKNLKLLERQEVTSFKIPLYLYQNLDVFPMQFVANGIAFQKEEEIEKNFGEIAAFTGSFRDTTFIECNDCGTAGTSGGTLSIVSKTATSTLMKVNMGGDGWVVLNMTLIPGWKAFVDDVEAKIYYANHAFQAVRVSKGEHSVSFQYSPVI